MVNSSHGNIQYKVYNSQNLFGYRLYDPKFPEILFYKILLGCLYQNKY